MTCSVPFLDRRRLLALASGLSLAAGGRSAFARPVLAAPAFPETATILVAGPDGGSLDRWSRLLQPALAHSLSPQSPVRRMTTGAADGVTGANRFDARSERDGQTALLAPGEAALAWLVGDPRAKYDISQWVSVMAIAMPGVIIARPGAIGAEHMLRMATGGPATADLPAILGIELMGARIEMLPSRAGTVEPAAAFASGVVDAVFLRGYKVPQQAASLAAVGGRPVFTLGGLDSAGRLGRCPAFPDVPTLPEFYAKTRGKPPAGRLFAAWSAAAVASQTECALVLPLLTPAAMIALWRSAAADSAASLDVQSVALSLNVRVVGGADATAAANACLATQAAVMELRHWLAVRFGWQPS